VLLLSHSAARSPRPARQLHRHHQQRHDQNGQCLIQPGTAARAPAYPSPSRLPEMQSERQPLVIRPLGELQSNPHVFCSSQTNERLSQPSRLLSQQLWLLQRPEEGCPRGL
jgi:hypothetical protein